MLRILLWITILVPLVATSPNFWGDEVTPRLRVNYLSQANGKHFYHILGPKMKAKVSEKHLLKGQNYCCCPFWPFAEYALFILFALR